jgi:transcriptional regulator with XRE-family HTH domain
VTANEPDASTGSWRDETPESREVGGGSETWTLADKINHLFDTVRRDDGTRYSNDEVAARLGAEDGGTKISGSYVWMLRNGKRDNPTKKHLEFLAKFFSVSPAYFFDDVQSEKIAEELQLLRALADSGVKQIATRLGGLSADNLTHIAAIIETIRGIEGLDARKAGDGRAD